MDLKQLTKKQVRYWCFRFKNEFEGGCDANDAPEGLKEYFETHDYFLGWDKFNGSLGWDVNFNSPLDIVPLKVGGMEAWNKELSKNAIDLPSGKNKQVNEPDVTDESETNEDEVTDEHEIKISSKKKYKNNNESLDNLDDIK